MASPFLKWGDISNDNPLPVTGAFALPSGSATSANQLLEIAQLQTLNALVPSVYDYISLGYTGEDLTSVVYKLGGSGGSIVSTLTLTYSGGALQTVMKT